MADIFVSYTSNDRDWAFWIGQELQKFGHTPHIHEWEIKGSEDIYSWMQQRIEAADHMLCVTSEAYLTASYSTQERNAALWKSANSPGFALIVVVEPCDIPTMFANLKRYQLHDVDEQEARNRLAAIFVVGAPSKPVSFPGMKTPVANVAHSHVPFPGSALTPKRAVSNIPITVPLHFLGRDQDIAAIDAALKTKQARAAITTALHGLRGVGKTTLAAAYAQQRRGDYRATWWIRSETIPTMRADLVGLGVRMGWVIPDEKEEPALVTVLERLRDEGEGILLLYDNANNANEISPYMPHAGEAHILVTSNAPNWSGVAMPVEIEKWPNEIGANYLVAQAGRPNERNAALALSTALDGLPLAHEQAASYCARTGLSVAEYRRKFEAKPTKFLDSEKDASPGYHNRRTAAKTFALAIDEAARLHRATEPLIVYAALLAPEPIPLYFFSEAAEKFGESFAAAIAGDGLDEAVAALRAFALIDRELIPDERDPNITTDCIRLHRLVRQVAAARCEGGLRDDMQRALLEAMLVVYPREVWSDPTVWSRARRMDALAMALANEDLSPQGKEKLFLLLDRLASYRHVALAAYAEARVLFERALALAENMFGADHPSTATSLNNLARLLHDQGDFSGARPLLERALMIDEKALGVDDLNTAMILNNLGGLLNSEHDLLGLHGDLTEARSYYERALAIRERALGPDHPDIAASLNNLGGVLDSLDDLAGAKPLYERALVIHEKAFGPDHLATAVSINNLGYLLRKQGDLGAAQHYYERALAIREKSLGPNHPDTAVSLNNLGFVLWSQDNLAEAQVYYERALAISDGSLGTYHPVTKTCARNTVLVLDELGHGDKAKALREKYAIGD